MRINSLTKLIGAASIAVTLGLAIPGVGASAGAAPSASTQAVTFTGPHSARIQPPTLAIGQSWSDTVTFPNGATGQAYATSITQAKPGDWNTVYELSYSCDGGALSWYHVYEGMSGNGTSVTNTTYPSRYSGGALSVENYTDPAPRHFITGGRGYEITGREFGNGWGPFSLHELYHFEFIVHGNGSWTPRMTVTCTIIG